MWTLSSHKWDLLYVCNWSVILRKENTASASFPTFHYQHSLTDSQHRRDPLRRWYWNRLKEVTKKRGEKNPCCWITRGSGAAPAVRSTSANAADSWVGWHQQQPWRSDHMCESGALTSLTDKVALPTETERKQRDSGRGRRAAGVAKRRFCINDHQHWRAPVHLFPNKQCDAGGASLVCLASVRGQTRSDAACCCLSTQP